MNFSENDNIYEFNAINVLGKYAGSVEGTPECLVLVCSDGGLSAAAKSAIAASCEKLDAGECAWVSTGAISAKDLFELAEGLDPAVLIVTDEASAKAVGDAYGCAIPLDACSRVFGRTCAVFRDFDSLLADASSKQRAWAILKQLK